EVEPQSATPAAPEGTHVVRRGDTLWGLSQNYFRNPWYWPKLWALNPAITNPHWIYPGDVLRLRLPGGGAGAPALPPSLAAPSSSPAGPAMKITKDGLVDNGIHLRQTGFVEPGELRSSGSISASKEEKLMLSTLDEAYVEYEEGNKPKPGERYTIYKVEREVKRADGEVIGNVVEIAG